jgi:signal transduction histidine kinase
MKLNQFVQREHGAYNEGIELTMHSKQIRVLLVEDNRADRVFIHAMLTGKADNQIELQEAHSLAIALNQLQQKQFEAVLLDLSLPDADDLEACISLRKCHPTLPIIVLTGHDDEQLAIEALQKGSQDYLVKGRIDRDLLARSICYAIERKKIEVALQSARDELEHRVEERTAELRQANQELQREMAERMLAEEREREHREDLAHISRLDTIGEMATNLAHEINQPLAAIVGYTKSCLRRLRSGDWDVDQLIETLEKAASEAKRGGEIIRRLRQLVRKRAPETSQFCLNDVVRDALALSEPETHTRQIVVSFKESKGLPAVNADRIQIEQVLLNLLRNAFEALEHGSAEGREVCVQTGVCDEDFIEFTVSNSGVDRTVKELECLFEPFYSTKRDGLGMGLAISRTIMETHGGQLLASRNSQGGLTFRCTLPIANLTDPVDERTSGIHPQEGR